MKGKWRHHQQHEKKRSKRVDSPSYPACSQKIHQSVLTWHCCALHDAALENVLTPMYRANHLFSKDLANAVRTVMARLSSWANEHPNGTIDGALRTHGKYKQNII
ncbi:MAG TPA: hypothetical protein VGE50_08535 [Gammaproteobacteria bacterium]